MDQVKIDQWDFSEWIWKTAIGLEVDPKAAKLIILKNHIENYRVFTKEGQKVKAHYTAKICLFGASIG